MSRVVMFGPYDEACVALRAPGAVACLTAVADDDPPHGPARELGAVGLLDREGDRWRLSPRVIRLTNVDVGVPARAAADLIRGARDELTALLAGQGQGWSGAGFALVAGALLDLAVGEELHAAGVTPPSPARSQAWLLDPTTFSFGVHCIYHEGVRAGAGIIWTNDSPGQPGTIYPELPAQLATADGVPAARLRLRYLGWLRGDEPEYVTWARTGHDPVTRLARRLARSVYEPLLHEVAPHDPDSRHAVGRLLMEHAVQQLLADGTLRCGPSDLRRLRWSGDNLLLAGG